MINVTNRSLQGEASAGDSVTYRIIQYAQNTLFRLLPNNHSDFSSIYALQVISLFVKKGLLICTTNKPLPLSHTVIVMVELVPVGTILFDSNIPMKKGLGSRVSIRLDSVMSGPMALSMMTV